MSFANCDQAPSLIHTSLHSNPPTDKHIFIWRTRTTLPFSEPTAGLSADSLTSESVFYICGLSSQVVDYHHNLWTINTNRRLPTQTEDYQHKLTTTNTIRRLPTQSDDYQHKLWTSNTIWRLSTQFVDVSTSQRANGPIANWAVQLSTLALFVWVSADRTIRRATYTIDLIWLMWFTIQILLVY